MYKTVRNLTILGVGLGASAVVGWLLLRETKRQDSEASVTIKSQRRQSELDESPQIVLPLDALDAEDDTPPPSTRHDTNAQTDDLTQINDIGPRFAEALAAIGITRFADLAQQDAETLAARLAEHVTVRARRIQEKDWIGQAARLAEQR